MSSVNKLAQVILLATFAAAPVYAAKIGDSCSTNSDCSGVQQLACFDKLCACKPGYYACGDSRCVDLANDANHCGACTIQCGDGKGCLHGMCGGPIVPSTSSASSVFRVAPNDCRLSESSPTLSLTSGVAFQIAATGSASQPVTWAAPSDYTTWTTAGHMVPEQVGEQFGDTPYYAQGDAWSTSSGYNGQEYPVARTHSGDKKTGGTAPSAPFVAAVLPSGPPPTLQSLEGNDAAYISRLFWPPGLIDDALTVAADPGGASFWALANGNVVGGHEQPLLISFPKCGSGFVADPSCARDTSFGLPPSLSSGFGGVVDVLSAVPGRAWGGGEQVSVMVNPCTHHALAAFMTHDVRSKDQATNYNTKHGYIEVVAVDHAGQAVQVAELPISWPDADTRCTDAGSTNPFDCAGGLQSICPGPNATNSNCCWSNEKDSKGMPQCGDADAKADYVSRALRRVQMDIKASVNSDGHAECTLFLGWDETHGYPTARRQATFGSVRVTNESSQPITVLFQAPAESLYAAPVASRFAGVYGLFYVQRDSTLAHEVVHARVSTDPTFASADDIQISGATPFDNVGMTDQVAQLAGGLPGGTLLGTWVGRPDAKSKCNTILGSVVSVAQSCGASGYPCCDALQSCQPDLSCAGTSSTGNYCIACGHPDQPCCPATGVGSCAIGASCVANECVCGLVDTACCQPGNTCGAGLHCSQFFCVPN